MCVLLINTFAVCLSYFVLLYPLWPGFNLINLNVLYTRITCAHRQVPPTSPSGNDDLVDTFFLQESTKYSYCCFKCHLRTCIWLSAGHKPKAAQYQKRSEKKSDTCTVLSPYKVINSTLLAHIHFIAGLPAGEKKKKRVSHKKSLRGKIMLEQRAEWGSIDSIQLLVFHIGWDTFNASYVQNTAAQSHQGNDRIITLVKGQKVGQHISFDSKNRKIARFGLK